jgi:hypothetical protein
MHAVRFARMWSVVFLAVGLLISARAVGAVPSPITSSWRVVPSPNAFSGNNQLEAVTSISTGDGWAVGSYCCSGRNFGLGTLMEHWNGSAWTISAGAVDTRFFDEKLLGVAAVSSADVWAVGNVKRTGFRDPGSPLVMHFDGTAWRQAAAPGSGRLGAVAALSADNVWAVGATRTATQVEHWNGSSWSVVPSPSPGFTAALNGIAAVAPNAIWAVGQFVADPYNPVAQTLVEHWDGTSWQIVASPNADGPNHLLGATAVSASDVWAVGASGVDIGSSGRPPGTRTLTEHWNGSEWQIVSSPDVDNENVLQGVAARSGTDVATVGHYTKISIPAEQTQVEEWHGTAWRITPSGNANTSDNRLDGATATLGGGPMWAVGFHLNEAAPYQTLILRRD